MGPTTHPCHANLLARAKKPRLALVAIMRKLIHGNFGMTSNGGDLDSSRLFPNVSPDA